MSIVAKRGRKGLTDFYHDPSGTFGTRATVHRWHVVEILGPGNQTVIPPTPHPETGQPYHWITPRRCSTRRHCDLPVIPPDIGDRLARRFLPGSNRPARQRRHGHGPTMRAVRARARAAAPLRRYDPGA